MNVFSWYSVSYALNGSNLANCERNLPYARARPNPTKARPHHSSSQTWPLCLQSQSTSYIAPAIAQSRSRLSENTRTGALLDEQLVKELWKAMPQTVQTERNKGIRQKSFHSSDSNRFEQTRKRPIKSQHPPKA